MFKEVDPKEALKLLKEEAIGLGIKFNPNIGFEKLKAKVDEFKENNSSKELTEEELAEIKEKEEFIKKAKLAAEKMKGADPKTVLRSKMTKQELIMDVMKEANRLVRVSITCLDPSKKDMKGTMMGVRNSKIPLNKYFVPYDGKVTHLPRILVNHLKEKEFQSFHLVEDPVSGERIRRSRIGKMFSVVELELLSEEELDKLARAQKAAGTIQ